MAFGFQAGPGRNPPPNIRRRLARNLRRLRRAQGLSPEGLADAAGLREVQIRGIEAGEIDVRIDTLQKIAAALGVRVFDLLNGRP